MSSGHHNPSAEPSLHTPAMIEFRENRDSHVIVHIILIREKKKQNSAQYIHPTPATQLKLDTTQNKVGKCPSQ